MELPVAALPFAVNASVERGCRTAALHSLLETQVENYFNYFTEIEECFRRCRSAHTTANPRMLLTPVDWALVESWKEAGIPLEAALTGIERTFEKWQRRPRRFQRVNSVGFCSQEVLRAAEEARTAQTETGRRGNAKTKPAPFSANEVTSFFNSNARALEAASGQAQRKGQAALREELAEAASSLNCIAARASGENLEEIERHLTALEEKLVASLTRASSVELLAEVRAEVDQGIIPYRGKMTGPQIEALERQFLKKRLFEYYEIPRLSLFYL
jgi:hypothetical protein